MSKHLRLRNPYTVRQSLGADISGSLFGSTKNVLAEGYTDKLYLNTFSNYFRQRGEDATFDYQTSLVDVDGSKTEYMVRFLDAEGYDYAILLDDDDAEDAKSHKETLVEKDVDEDRIILVSDVLDDADEDAQVEIEDLLPAEIFCEVVAEQYPDGVDPDELVEATGEEYNTMPDAVKAKLQAIEEGELEPGAFDKGDIAETICDRIASGDYGEEELGEETLEAFEALIQVLNENLSRFVGR